MSDSKSGDKPVLFGIMDAPAGVTPRRLKARLGPDYIPGYSEVIMANDLDTSEILTQSVKDKYFQVDFGRGPEELPFLFKWVRVTGPTGEDSVSATEDAFEYTKVGYKPVQLESKEDFARQFGPIVTGFPPAAHLGADGLIRHRDSALFYVDAKTADRLERERIEDNKRLLGHNQPGGVKPPSPYDFEIEERYTRRLGTQTP